MITFTPTKRHASTHVSAPTLAWFSRNCSVAVEWCGSDIIRSSFWRLGARGSWRAWGALVLALVAVATCALIHPLIGCVGAVVVGCAFLQAICRWRPATCPEVEHLVGEVVGLPVAVSAPEAGTPAPGPLPTGGAVRRWLDSAILKFGRMNDTPADRRVLRLWLAEEMKKADMRDRDAVRLIPLIVEFMFIPGVEDLMAKLVRESLAKGIIMDLHNDRLT